MINNTTFKGLNIELFFSYIAIQKQDIIISFDSLLVILESSSAMCKVNYQGEFMKEL
jgi:hypothetical protein